MVNVFDPNDIAHVHPQMSSPEFMQDVNSAFKAVLSHVERLNIQKSCGGMMVPQHGPNKRVESEPVDSLTLANEQFLHDS